jgi:hypothetical protein
MAKPTPPDALSDPLARPAPARLRLNPGRGHHGAVDGGWWPRSRDAGAELPALIVALDVELGAISRFISVHVDTWDTIPHRFPVGDHSVRVGWYRSMDPHSVSVTMDRGDPIQLLVVPAETASTPAAAALAKAASGQDQGRPTDILAASNTGTRASTPQAADRDQQRWENEGGQTSAASQTLR